MYKRSFVYFSFCLILVLLHIEEIQKEPLNEVFVQSLSLQTNENQQAHQELHEYNDNKGANSWFMKVSIGCVVLVIS